MLTRLSGGTEPRPVRRHRRIGRGAHWNLLNLSSIDFVKYNGRMSTTDIAHNLSWLFLQVSYRSKQSMLRLAEEYDLTMQQLYTLIFMEPSKELKMNEVAQILVCDPSNVTGIIDRLFARNIIVRQEKPGDRRVKMVTLTPEGRKLREDIIGRITANEPPVFDRLDNDKKRELVDLLQTLLAD